MKKVLLLLDFLFGPVQGFGDIEGDYIKTNIDIIDNDTIIRDLNKRINKLWCSFYESSETDPSGFTFNSLKAKENKDNMANLCNQLLYRFNEINDGSFEIENRLNEALDDM